MIELTEFSQRLSGGRGKSRNHRVIPVDPHQRQKFLLHISRPPPRRGVILPGRPSVGYRCLVCTQPTRPMPLYNTSALGGDHDCPGFRRPVPHFRPKSLLFPNPKCFRLSEVRLPRVEVISRCTATLGAYLRFFHISTLAAFQPMPKRQGCGISAKSS